MRSRQSRKSALQVVLDVMKYGQRIKKTCVVVGNCTGFCVNRVFAPYTQAACILLDAGMDPYLIDKVIAGFGMPMGPFRCRCHLRTPTSLLAQCLSTKRSMF
jgi:enoyl-CoA hydratase/3-hydroxyacyl-CoA dehydrogenase